MRLPGAGWDRAINWIRVPLLWAALGLTACGDDSAHVQVASVQQGATPFITQVELTGSGLQNLSHLAYSILPKANAASAPVVVHYSIAALQRKGAVIDSTTATMKIPVFGLYAGYANHVTFRFDYENGSRRFLNAVITTDPYTDPTGLYDQPNILKRRTPGTALDFDFFVVKSALGSPVVLDTDGEIRWVGPSVGVSQSTIIQKDGFLVGDTAAPILHQIGFDGSHSQGTLPDDTITGFHHNIDPGKRGVLAEVNAAANGVASVETILVELAPDGNILQKWDLAAIIGDYMRSQGDDPSSFVRPGADWFHMNASTYDPSDDSIIVSSRENFLIKLDYGTGNIRWIFGDPKKYWHTFASLRAKALTLQGAGWSPIGQHGISITTDGLLMMFDDGLGSRNQPPGAPAGDNLSFSRVTAYAIDEAGMSATQRWEFDYTSDIYSSICSSAYEPGNGRQSLLVDYAAANEITQARLVGLNPAHDVVFDFEYPTTGCNTAWNAIPIGFNNLVIE